MNVECHGRRWGWEGGGGGVAERGEGGSRESVALTSAVTPT